MNEEIYALIIGIGKYKADSIIGSANSDIACAVSDAQAIEQLLITSGGLKTFNVRTLINAQATWEGINNVLNDWGGENGRANDATVLFFFSGHGYRRKAGADKGSYLCPYDADIVNGHLTSFFSFDDLRAALQNLNANSLFLFLDCCYAAGLAGSKGLVDFADFAGGDEFSIFASSQEGETSKCGDPHSLYTTYLLEALAGQGSDTAQEYINFASVSEYVRNNVVAQSNGSQHPFATRNGKHPEILPNPNFQDATAPTAAQLIPPKPANPDLVAAFTAADWRGKLADYLAATIATDQPTADDDIFLATTLDSLRDTEPAAPSLLTQLIQRWNAASNCWFPSNFNGPDIFTLYEQINNADNTLDPVIQRFAAMIKGGQVPRPTWAWWEAAEDNTRLAQIATALRVVAARYVTSKINTQTDDTAIVATLTPVAASLAAAVQAFGGLAVPLARDAAAAYFTIERANVRLAQAAILALVVATPDPAQLQPQVDAIIKQALAPLDTVAALDPSPTMQKRLQKVHASAYNTLAQSLPLVSPIRLAYEKQAMDIWKGIFQHDAKDDEVCVSMANALRNDPATRNQAITLYKTAWTRSKNNNRLNWVAGLEYAALASQPNQPAQADIANILLQLAQTVNTLTDEAVRQHDYRLVDVYTKLGNVYYNLSNYQEACKWLAQAIDTNDKAGRELAILSYSRACLMLEDFTAPYPKLTSMRDKPIADIRIYYYLAAVAGPNNDSDSRNWAIKKALERESSLSPLT